MRFMERAQRWIQRPEQVEDDWQMLFLSIEGWDQIKVLYRHHKINPQVERSDSEVLVRFGNGILSFHQDDETGQKQATLHRPRREPSVSSVLSAKQLQVQMLQGKNALVVK